MRRTSRYNKPSSPEGLPCSSYAVEPLSIFHINVRGFVSHSDELSAVLTFENYLTYVGISETFLNDSVEDVDLPGYTLVSRRDRRNGSGGGICLFVKSELEDTIVHIADSTSHERSWHVIHADIGPILLGLNYRPPAKGDVSFVETLQEEFLARRDAHAATVLVGDFNVHEVTWLRFSSGTSPEGRRLRDFCCDYAFKEFTKCPSHAHGNLLDLTLSDLEQGLSTRVVGGVAGNNDHFGVHVSLT